MSGNTSQKSNSLLDAIDHLNKGGTKYFHMNDGSYPSVESQNRENGDASASGRFSLAIGRLANATAENAIAIGTDSAATATQAIAIGHQAQAKAENGLVLGTNALVTAISGVALGEGSVAMRAGMKGQTVTTAEFNINTSKAVYAPSSASAESQAAVVATASNSVGAVSVGSDKITRQITNVAAGSADSDAVNVAQLRAVVSDNRSYVNNAISQVNNRIDQVENRVNQVNNNMKAGVASAVAIASMPQAAFPSHSVLSLGMGNYQGKSAFVVGYSKMSDTGKVSFKLNASASQNGNVAVGAGVGFSW